MGEDPFLAAKMVVPYIKGVQANGVAACVKHFALNNQETKRNSVNVIVDDRALYEIYLPAFKAAVQEGEVWAKPYSEMIRKGEVGTKELDEKVRRILRLSFLTTMDRNRPFGSFGTQEHADAGRKIAEEGIVLLQNNNNILPINLSKTKKIAVIGENAIKMMTVGG